MGPVGGNGCTRWPPRAIMGRLVSGSEGQPPTGGRLGGLLAAGTPSSRGCCLGRLVVSGAAAQAVSQRWRQAPLLIFQRGPAAPGSNDCLFDSLTAPSLLYFEQRR